MGPSWLKNAASVLIKPLKNQSLQSKWIADSNFEACFQFFRHGDII